MSERTSHRRAARRHVRTLRRNNLQPEWRQEEQVTDHNVVWLHARRRKA